MNLQDQVTSLELSKKLKDLGVKQESLFYHAKTGYSGDYTFIGTPKEMSWHKELELHDEAGANTTYDLISAFTVAELEEMLPTKIEEGTWFNYTKSLNGWGGICERVSYDKWEKHEGAGQLLIKHMHEVNSHPYRPHETPEHTHADLYAKMLIYLLDNNLLPL